MLDLVAPVRLASGRYRRIISGAKEQSPALGSLRDLSPNFPPVKSRVRGCRHAHRDGGGQVAATEALAMTRWFWLPAALSSAVTITARGQTPPGPYNYRHHMMWDWGYGMIFGPLFMILVLAGVIALIMLLVRWPGGPWQGSTPPYYPPPARTPLDILKERYARGEIDKQEFEDRRRVLGD